MTLSVAEMQRVVREGVPLAAAWGVEVLSAAEGVATLRLPHHEDLLRPGGTVSGPALMGLADVAMWAALLSLNGGRRKVMARSRCARRERRPPARMSRRVGRRPGGAAWPHDAVFMS